MKKKSVKNNNKNEYHHILFTEPYHIYDTFGEFNSDINPSNIDIKKDTDIIVNDKMYNHILNGPLDIKLPKRSIQGVGYNNEDFFSLSLLPFKKELKYLEIPFEGDGFVFGKLFPLRDYKLKLIRGRRGQYKYNGDYYPDQIGFIDLDLFQKSDEKFIMRDIYADIYYQNNEELSKKWLLNDQSKDDIIYWRQDLVKKVHQNLPYVSWYGANVGDGGYNYLFVHYDNKNEIDSMIVDISSLNIDLDLFTFLGRRGYKRDKSYSRSKNKTKSSPRK